MPANEEYRAHAMELLQAMADNPDSSDHDREMARHALELAKDGVPIYSASVYVDEPSVEMLAQIDENITTWIETVREQRPTTAELANNILGIPPGFTEKENTEIAALCLANCLQRLAFQDES
jgi:hypothetical protein